MAGVLGQLLYYADTAVWVRICESTVLRFVKKTLFFC